MTDATVPSSSPFVPVIDTPVSPARTALIVGAGIGGVEAGRGRVTLLGDAAHPMLPHVYACRKKPSRLNWWLRPSHGEREFTITWLIYAVIFGAAALAIVLFL